ncbi:alkaline phosphatase family protein [Bacillus sp. AFS029533]|uniref:LamG-like jellyroll fold domain-containing protein n=1 Tax=Bacillus sp. AFS029533 TaxID=2033494 RepID=UPI000BFE0464|nr:alkaline phosphatase family protein [Bacillus sp. AFS029533]PGZ92038.1 antitoxin [Bacillus sp. AFS029533]
MKSNMFKKVVVGTSLTLAISLSVKSTYLPFNVLSNSSMSSVAFASEGTVLDINFDNNVEDSSSSTITPQIKGNPGYVQGRINQAIKFTSKGQYVDLGNRDDLRFGETTDFSVAFWVKADNIQGDPAIISNKNWNSGSNTGWNLALNSSKQLDWNFKTSGSDRKDYIMENVADNQWHFIVVTHDRDGSARFYKDGSLVHSIDISGMKGTLDTSFTTKIGQDGTGNYGSTLNAAVDNLKIYRNVLSESEVRAMYDNAPPLQPTSVESISLDQTELNLKAGAPMPLTATVSPSDATVKDVEWTSSNGSVAKIEMLNNRPTIIAVKAGEATITAKTVDGGKTATANVHVSNSIDVSGDGLLTDNDLKLILKNQNSREGDKRWKHAQIADINNDKKVDKLDVQMIKDKLAPYKNDFLYKRVVFIGIDGAGNGVKDPQANAINIKTLMSEGAGTYEAKAMMPTISGHNWGSMLHGVVPSKHGLNNDNLGNPYPEKNPYPSYMKLLKQERPMLNQASFTTWSPINKGIIEDSAGAYKVNGGNDNNTTQKTVDYIKAEGKNSRNIFVHLDEVDGAGHNYGYGSQRWYEALQKADQHVGQIVQTLEEEGLIEDTLIIITADHGGKGYGHGGSSPEEQTIFWTAKGKSLKPGTVLSDVENIDTAAVVAHALRLDIPENWDAQLPSGLFQVKK